VAVLVVVDEAEIVVAAVVEAVAAEEAVAVLVVVDEAEIVVEAVVVAVRLRVLKVHGKL